MTHDAAATRPDTARAALDALVSARMRTPFAWGVHDCCLWAADAVLAQTGVDPAAAYRGQYTTALEAARLVERLGGLRAIGAQAGPEIAPLAAQVGDVGLVSDGERALLGVCAGGCWLAPTAAGLGALPLSAAAVAWRVCS